MMLSSFVIYTRHFSPFIYFVRIGHFTPAGLQSESPTCTISAIV